MTLLGRREARNRCGAVGALAVALPSRASRALRRVVRVRRDGGSMSVFVIGLAVVLFGVAGLAIDGGRVINAKDRAFDVAEQSARAGANQINVDVLRSTGQVVLSPDAAQAAARDYVAQNSGYTVDGPIGVTATTVTVSLRATIPTTLLSLVHIDTIDIAGSATASAVTGINGAVP